MITKNVKTGAYTYKNESIPFNFYTELRAVDKIKFINAVCDTLIDTNYYSVIRDLVYLKLYINPDTIEKRLIFCNP